MDTNMDAKTPSEIEAEVGLAESGGEQPDELSRAWAKLPHEDRLFCKRMGLGIGAVVLYVVFAAGAVMNSQHGREQARWEARAAYAAGEVGHDKGAQVCREMNEAFLSVLNNGECVTPAAEMSTSFDADVE